MPQKCAFVWTVLVIDAIQVSMWIRIGVSRSSGVRGESSSGAQRRGQRGQVCTSSFHLSRSTETRAVSDPVPCPCLARIDCLQVLYPNSEAAFAALTCPPLAGAGYYRICVATRAKLAGRNVFARCRLQVLSRCFNEAHQTALDRTSSGTYAMMTSHSCMRAEWFGKLAAARLAALRGPKRCRRLAIRRTVRL